MDRLRIAEPKPPSWRSFVLLFVGVTGLSASITAMFLAMRAVLGVGGFCAEGGPFVIATPCPPGVTELMFPAMLGWFIFAGVIAAAGSRLGGVFGTLAFLAWPGLFLALGWNFLEFGLAPPEGGIEMGFFVPGVIFWLMGGGPLLVAGWAALGSFRYHRRADALEARAAAAGGSGSSVGSSATRPTGQTLPPSRSVREARAAVARAMGAVVTRAVRAPAAPPAPATPGAAAPAATPTTARSPDRDTSLVEGLERLAELRRRGDLSLMEYDAAKRALIREHEARS